MGLLDRFKRTPEQRAASEAKRVQDASRRTEEREARERVDPAHSQGTVHRSEYIPSDRTLAELTVGGNRLPAASLKRRGDRLLLVTASGGMVNPKSTTLHKLGIFSFSIRGTQYYPGAKTGDFRPGAPVRLIREPAHEHDPNAVAVFAWRARKPAGYVNKQNAARLAKLLDGGADMVAVATRGAGPGQESTVPQVMACERNLMIHLLKGSGISLPESP